MIDIQMDLTTSVTILTGLTTILGFMWKVFERRKKTKDEDNKEEQELRKAEQKLENRLTALEKTDGDQEVEIKKLLDTCESLRDENARLKKDLLDNLDRLEARLEKMLDLIISNFKQ